MTDILKLNEISPKVSEVFKANYGLTDSAAAPAAIMVRSFNMHEYTPSESVLCVGRAGAGTNNIPLDKYADSGIVVFNTPGANANAVKELVLAALFSATRNLYPAAVWANTLVDGEKTVSEQVEKGKKAFVGSEILGKTLGVYGLGAIGRKIAASANALGMTIVGYDPYVSEEAKKTLGFCKIVDSKEELFALSDFITFHVPLTPETKNLICADTIAQMKDGVVLINCSRGDLCNNEDIIAATESGKVGYYVTDFANSAILNKKKILCFPHLGASTEEAEDNCAVMAAKQIVDYIENGNIVNSVNFPSISAQKGASRTVVLFKGENAQTAIQKVVIAAKAVAAYKMKKDYGVCLIDTDVKLSDKELDTLNSINGVLKVRSI